MVERMQYNIQNDAITLTTLKYSATVIVRRQTRYIVLYCTILHTDVVTDWYSFRKRRVGRTEDG